MVDARNRKCAKTIRSKCTRALARFAVARSSRRRHSLATRSQPEFTRTVAVEMWPVQCPRRDRRLGLDLGGTQQLSSPSHGACRRLPDAGPSTLRVPHRTQRPGLRQHLTMLSAVAMTRRSLPPWGVDLGVRVGQPDTAPTRMLSSHDACSVGGAASAERFVCRPIVSAFLGSFFSDDLTVEGSRRYTGSQSSPPFTLVNWRGFYFIGSPNA